MSRELVEVHIDSLRFRPQVRTATGLDDPSLAGLAQSMKETGGIHQPILVRRDGEGLIVLDGERRARAARLAGLQVVPVVIDGGELSETEVFQRQLVLDVQRSSLSVVERGRAIAALIEKAGITREQVAQRVGISPASVTRMLAVLSLPESIQKLILEGRISADSAYLLSRIDNPDEQARLAQEVTEGLLSRDALTRKLKRVRRSQEARGGTRLTATIGSGKTITFVGGDLTLDTVTDWLEQLLAKARKAKTQGLTLQTFLSALRDQAKAAGKSGGNA